MPSASALTAATAVMAARRIARSNDIARELQTYLRLRPFYLRSVLAGCTASPHRVGSPTRNTQIALYITRYVPPTG
eukprot:COSAG01_NODE_2690_length_7247_cov_30.101567_1_plen_76_part_00